MRHLLGRLTAAVVAALALALPAGAEGQLIRERTEREWAVKLEKLETTLQPLMRRHGIDMWIVMTRENDPDPVVQLFGDQEITALGHRNAYIFYDPGGDRPLERTILGTHVRGEVLPFFPHGTRYGHGYGEEGLAPHLREFVHGRDPRRIAINRSRTITMADGLSLEAYEYLSAAVGPEYQRRFVPAEPLVIDYVSHRTPAELEIAIEASWITWNILRRAFSNEVITPGVTTSRDVYWWIVNEWRSQHLDYNFPASITIRRQGLERTLPAHEAPVIQPGDLIHVDFGVRLMGIVTDQQKQIYVLRPGETEPPAGLRALFAQSVRMAEIVAEELKPGVEGREVKARGSSTPRACYVRPRVRPL